MDAFGAHNRFLGVEVSQPMLEAARERFGRWEGATNWYGQPLVEVRNLDLRTDYPPERCSLTLCVLTLQFVPIEHRLKVVRSAFKHTVPGGALILVEKVLGASADLDATMVELYHQHKLEAGYSQDEIDRKALSLEGVLVPLTAEWNERMLRINSVILLPHVKMSSKDRPVASPEMSSNTP